MMKQVLMLVLLLAGLVQGAPESGSAVEKTKGLGWEMKADPKLPDVLILGDSISIGYTLQVRELLKGKANVYRPVAANGKQPENCSGTTAGLQGIDRWLGKRKWKVIHFNWGLHDLKHVNASGANSNRAEDPFQANPQQYAENLEKIVVKLEATGAKLIFATTTPVVVGTTNPLREADAPSQYNTAALKIMKAHGIEVNDLFGLCQPHLAEWQLPKNVHFKPAGSQAMAKQVAGVIGEALAD